MDWTLHASDLLVLGGFFLIVIMRMTKMETKVDIMWTWLMGSSPGDGPRRRSADDIYRRLRKRDTDYGSSQE